MKQSYWASALKELVFRAGACGVLWLGAFAHAQDVVSIRSDQAGLTYWASGMSIDFKVTLAGKFQLNSLGGTAALYPELRMVVNGDVAFAQLYSLSQYKVAATNDRTDCIFRYTIKPGDMAQPLRIYGSPTVPYQFYWNGWEIRNSTTLANAVWTFNAAASLPAFGEVYDIDLAKANITLRTLYFDDSHSPSSVTATESLAWRVTTVNPVGSAVVDFCVWTPGTNIVQIGTMPNQSALYCYLATGATYVDVPVRGLAVGTTEIYLQRTRDYQNNGTLGLTNFIKRMVTVTAAPEATVRVVCDNGTDNVSLDETDMPNTGSFHVELSETFQSDVNVRIGTLPVAQSNMTFGTAPAPVVVTVPAYSLVSPTAKFNVPDGTVLSYTAGVTMTPVVTNTAAAAKFTRSRSCFVYVRNVKPQIVQPLATDSPTAPRGEPFAFDWAVSDVPADVASGMTLAWDFGDGTANAVVSGAVGKVYHTFVTPVTGSGVKYVRVTATDKDGAVSDQVQFMVTVMQPLPKPRVRLVPSAYEFSETTTNNSGALTVILSEPFTEDVWVSLSATPVGQSNIVFGTTNTVRIASGSTSNAVGIRFSVPDGTLSSEMAGVEIIPAVTNGLAKSYYTDLQPVTVFAKNTRPKITKPLAADLAATPLAPFNNVPMGVPFAFDWTVADVPADGPAMAVTWDFGDGIVKTVTGLVGTVSHTYASMGDKTVTVRATDKDGGVSDDITFKVTVIQTVSTPTFSPVSGTAVTNSLTVTFSCATPGTTIRYTLDGSEPTAASPLYTGAITLTQNATVKAKAFKAGYTDSATAPANYTVVQTVASPLISPATGVTFTNSLVITLTCATADASIRYTLDGTPPTASSVLYSKTIKISKNSVVLARAFKAGMVDSETAEANYFKEISLAEAINVTNAVITTGGQAMWAGLNLASSHDGVDAAQSGPIAHSQSTWMSTAVNGPGAFSFWWKSSCEDDPDHDDWDYVVFVVDGVEKLRLDGITEWQRVACTLGEGSHVIIWKYMKDESLSDGADCAWVDQCSFVPGLPTATTTTPVPVPFAWLERYPDLLRMTGGDHEVAALVDPDLDGMPTWREYVAGSDPMDRDSVFRSLIMVSNGVPRLTWTPDLGTVRVYSVEGRTNLSAGAWGPTNAGSRFFRVKVGMP